jgi:tight adherence protein C
MTGPSTDRRSEMINLLQEAINALIASIESGATFDDAIYQYSQEADNELSQAFARVEEEIRSGVRRRQAVRNMAEQIDVPEVTGFIEAIIRADEEGMSILEMMKEQVEQIGAGAGN